MSIVKRYLAGEEVYAPTCDVCGTELADEYDFYDAVAAKKQAGWRSRKIAGEWMDMCPGCQEEDNHMSAVGDFG